MSLPSHKGPLSTSATATATNAVPEPPHDQKRPPDIIIDIDWDGPQDPENPKKSVHLTQTLGIDRQHPLSLCSWSFRRKWTATFVVSSFTFISPVSSSMVAPATFQVAADLGVETNAVIAMMTSIFVLGYG